MRESVTGINLNPKPLVSIVLAVRNEKNYIERALTSLQLQDTSNFELEILVIDGKSSDGTVSIVQRIATQDPRIRLIVNERQKTPAAFNLGIREARGEFVGIFGSHAEYDLDYVRTCLQELLERGVTACGGLVEMRPANGSLQAKLIAWALGHPFGTSSKSFRTRGEGYADSVNFPLMIKNAVIEIGGYDELLDRNQDNDLNQRLRARGHKLFLTGKTKCRHFGKATLPALFQYAFRMGSWNVISFRRNKRSMSLRHFVPFLFLMAILLSTGLLIAYERLSASVFLTLPLLVICGTHLLIGALASVQVSYRERNVGALLLPFVFLALHLSYGSGTLCSIFQHSMDKRAL